MEVEESDYESKPKLLCVICTQERNGSKSVESDNAWLSEENETLFSLVCKSLKIKLNKRNSWDFSKELLPFCHSCADISRELVEIEGQIRNLEATFQQKVEHIRNLIVKSDLSDSRKPCKKRRKSGRTGRGLGNENGRKIQSDEDETDKGTDEENILSRLEDGRFIYFRNQVVGPKGLRFPRKEFAKTKGSKIKSQPHASVPPKIRLKKLKTIEGSIAEIDSCSVRRSERVRQTTLQKIIPDDFSDVDDEPIHRQDFGDDDLNHDTLDQEDLSGQEEYCKKLNDLADLKPEIEIKQEIPSEAEHEFDVYDEVVVKEHKPSTSKSTSLEKGNSIKKENIKKIKITPKSKRRKRKNVSECEDDGDDDFDDSDSDFKPDKGAENSEAASSDYDSDGDKDNSSYFRKWKKDKKSNRMWYDGVEVLVAEKGLKCGKCQEIIEGDKGAKNKIKMKRHILLKHLEKFTCVLCSKVTSCKKYLDMHVKMVHEKSINIPCKICDKPFTSLNAMRRHAWNHQNEEEKKAAIAAGKKQYGIKKMETMQCGQCGKLCKGPYNLRRHEETHIDQKERMRHQCQICGALYSAPETLRSHIKMAHENNNQLQWLQCPQCPKKYPQPGRLEKHMRSHTGEKPFICSECGTGFSQPTLLKVHMLKHQNLRPHKCQHCDMSFFRRYHMQRHTQIYHESEKPPTKKQPYRSENGTRKAPQKRERKKGSYDIVERSETGGVIVGVPQQQQPQSTCESVDPQHILGIVGTLGDAPHNFSFTSQNLNYPYNYSFSSSGINQQ